MNYKTLDLKKVIVNNCLMTITKTHEKKVEELVKEGKGLNDILGNVIENFKGFVIEKRAKDIALKEVEISRKESIDRLEKMYVKTNSYLEKKRIFDVANEINEKYNYAVNEINNVYGSRESVSKKLGLFEEIVSITKSYYKMIVEDAERMRSTSS